MTPAGDAAGTAPGPRLESSACGGEAGPRSALPETREVPRPPVDPGPMPPRWERHEVRVPSVGRFYTHTQFLARVWMTDAGMVHVHAGVTAPSDSVESDMRDVVDLVAWLRRGGL